jgi:uncharacterized membrane protein
MRDRPIPDERAQRALFALIFASGTCLAMLGVRTLFSGHWELGFYIWNLVLAWIPLLLARRIYSLYAQRSPHYWLLAICAVLWFLFFPNAPYIVTDILHLRTRQPVPKWFDVVMMMSFAWTGLCLGYHSLYLMQEVARAWRGWRWSWGFAVLMLGLSSFGIYLGRFQRWNSWDVIARPLGLASDVIGGLRLAGNAEMFAFCATFFAFSLLSYGTLFTLTHLHDWAPSAAAGRLER